MEVWRGAARRATSPRAVRVRAHVRSGRNCAPVCQRRWSSGRPRHGSSPVAPDRSERGCATPSARTACCTVYSATGRLSPRTRQPRGRRRRVFRPSQGRDGSIASPTARAEIRARSCSACIWRGPSINRRSTQGRRRTWIRAVTTLPVIRRSARNRHAHSRTLHSCSRRRGQPLHRLRVLTEDTCRHTM